MIKIVKYYLFLLIIFFITSCGTREYLGFEKKKVRLEGKRVSILNEDKIKDPDSVKSSTNIVLEKTAILNNWPQSYNSPSHLSTNHLSDSKLGSFKSIVSGSGENKQSKILSQPVIDNNILFFLDAKSYVISFDLKNNKILWKKNISLEGEKDHNIGGGVVIYKNAVIVNSPYGQIISMDKLSGKVLWKINVESSIRSAPTVFDNKLLSLTLSNKLYVLNGDNGNLLWQHQGIFNNTTLMDTPKVAVDENIVIVPYSNGDFFALNLSNGKEIWRNSFIDLEIKETTNAFSDIDAFPVIKKDIVIISSAIGKLIAVNKKNGSKLWSRDIFTTQTPLVNGNSIFLVNNNKEVICLNILDGGSRWVLPIEKEISDNNKYIWLPPVLNNSQLLLVGGYKKLISIDVFSGQIKTKKNLSSFPASSPIIVNKKIYLMLRNGDIIQIE
ncbi:MAG: hypothetical protein CMJ06_03605 [Pelagibacterales bacterium]|nr:hypothetical protein [Pelagibacterales bacterium]OUU62239.1 MAG: hypothetical protein CBC22_05055 [Alphaproteobacteria bacterium TMED62]|tara:strand:+ start:2786 stop:4108 length:1323 start_codon:yes stop_codon:yes gene_type:complete